MVKLRVISLIFTICLLLGSITGCQEQTGKPSGTTRNESGSVLDLLDIQNDIVGSITIVNMGNGHSITIDDHDQIGRILERLARIQVVANRSDKGYTPTGYALTLAVGEQTSTREIQIQMDVTLGDDFAAFGGYYYEIDDQDSDELNDYFALAKYEYR